MVKKNSQVEDAFAKEGGVKETPSKKPEETEEQKKQTAEKNAKALAKAKELLFGYVKKYKCLMVIGLIFNLLGMVGEFTSPLFIGWVIDAIVRNSIEDVRDLTIMWMIVNTCGAIFQGAQSFIFAYTT